MTDSIFSTKAGTLARLAPLVRGAACLPQLTLNACATLADSDVALDRVAATFGTDATLIIRSSAAREDTANQSLAGAFTTVPHVRGADATRDALARVIASYGAALDPADEVLVQPMLRDVVYSGVAFSHDQATSAPYRTISVSHGPATDAVTAGKGNVDTYVVIEGSRRVPDTLLPVLDLVAEISALANDVPVDIEFAMARMPDGSERLYLLQARPLILPADVDAPSAQRHMATLDEIAGRVRTLQRPHPFLCGKTTVLGVMPDWNPAEIIGIRPRPLALSLYRDLLTDSTWAYQRHNYGYRNLRGFPLIQGLAGQPFVDVRLSFNSFIPGGLQRDLADRLVDHYLERLVAAPRLHDKIEFDIVFSCYTLDLPDRIACLSAAGFSSDDIDRITASLRKLTNRIVHREKALWKNDAGKIETLRKRHARIMAADLPPIQRIHCLMEDCRRYGTLPFAGLARAGFIAVQMLRSLVSTGVFTESEYQAFLGSVDTVAGQFVRDKRTLGRADLLDKYGHLRPGTYDIRSPRYDEVPDFYLPEGPADDAHHHPPPASFGLRASQEAAIARLLTQHGLSLDTAELMSFMRAGIEMREYAKFAFSRNLSDAISLFTEWGAGLGYNRDALSYADIRLVADLHARTGNAGERLGTAIEEGRAAYARTRSVWLPPLITSPEDVFGFEVMESEPNFITQKSTVGEVVRLSTGTARKDDLAGRIVLIESADPGFDWIFSHDIGGLITEFGGVNSHMAIRAAEKQLPAIIGAGSQLFADWSRAKRLQLDCAGRRVERIA